MFYVYVLLNPDDKIYIGQTDDLTRRHSQHNDPEQGLSKHTKRYRGPWQLVYAESFRTRSEALRRENALKSGQGRQWIKTVLIPGVGLTSGC